MRIIALDVHRSFAQTAILENGKLRDAGKIDLEYSRLLRFARKLKQMCIRDRLVADDGELTNRSIDQASHHNEGKEYHMFLDEDVRTAPEIRLSLSGRNQHRSVSRPY